MASKPKQSKVMVVKPKEKGKMVSQPIVDKVKKMIKDDMDIQVDSLFVNDTNIKIKSSNNQTLKKIQDCLLDDAETVEVVETQKLDPQIVFTVDASDAEDVNTFIKRNNLIPDIF